MPEHTFRRAIKKDVGALVELITELNQYHNDDFKPKSEKLIKDWDKFEVFIVEDSNNEIVAFLSGYDSYQLHATTLRYEIQNLHVKATHRKRGIGGLIMEETIAIKRSEGVEKFSLGVSKDNETARLFYKSLGFEENLDDLNIRCKLQN